MQGSPHLSFLVVALCAHGLAAASKPVDTAEEWRRSVRSSPNVPSIDGWEQLVKHSAAHLRSARDVSVENVGIADLQEYYRQIFDSKHGWGGDNQEYYYRKLHALEAYLEDNPEKAEMYEDKQEKLISLAQEKTKSIPNRYIVLLDNEATEYEVMRTIEVLKEADVESDGKLVADHIEPIWYAGRGFTATLGDRVVELVKKHPLIRIFEQDVALRRSEVSAHSYTTDSHASKQEKLIWNLDRLDQRDNNLDNVYNPVGTGQGVAVYVLDTGIRYSHNEFVGGRAKYGGYDAIDLLTGSQQKGADCSGHGTHCAGTIGGSQFGVAKSVQLYSVRVLDCKGTGAVSGIIKAMDYVLSRQTDSSPRAVFSMSLGVQKSNSLNSASDKAATYGVLVVAAAGNQGGDACTSSPGNADTSVSVGATDKNDEVQSFSNIGECLDLFAPGHMITSAGFSCDDCISVKSGTSMAAPHVTGYVAILLELYPNLTPAELKQTVVDNTSPDVVSFGVNTQRKSDAMQQLVADTPNCLLYVAQPDSSKLSK